MLWSGAMSYNIKIYLSELWFYSGNCCVFILCQLSYFRTENRVLLTMSFCVSSFVFCCFPCCDYSISLFLQIGYKIGVNSTFSGVNRKNFFLRDIWIARFTAIYRRFRVPWAQWGSFSVHSTERGLTWRKLSFII